MPDSRTAIVTGGRRGIMGPGTCRMNRYTVAIAKAAGRPQVSGTAGINRDLSRSGILETGGHGATLSAGVDIYSLRTDFLDQSSFENQSTGIGLRAGFPVSDHTNLGLTYTLVQDDTQVADVLVDHDSDPSTPAIDQCDRRNPARSSGSRRT